MPRGRSCGRTPRRAAAPTGRSAPLSTAPRGLAAARGDLLVLLDGDDGLRPTLIEKAHRRLARRGELHVVCPLLEHVDAAGERLGVRTTPPDAHRRAPRQPGPLRQRSRDPPGRGPDRRGGDEELTGYVGLDFWRRMLSLRPANAECLLEPPVVHRRHLAQITSSTGRMQRNFSRVTAKIEAGDPWLPPATLRRALAVQRLWWARIAHAGADHREARSHTAGAWRLDPPPRMALTPLAYARAWRPSRASCPRGCTRRRGGSPLARSR